MSKYQMDDGTIVDTSKATKSWNEATRWDGRNQISVNTGSQWDHETLYRSRKGRYYIVHESQRQGSTPRAEWISNHGAASWLLFNDEEVPEELQAFADDVTE